MLVGRREICAILKRHNAIVLRYFETSPKFFESQYDHHAHHVPNAFRTLGPYLLPRGFLRLNALNVNPKFDMATYYNLRLLLLSNLVMDY